MEENLRIPGPTPVPVDVLQAMTQPMINHRGPKFKAILEEVTSQLQTFYQTKNDVLIYPSSGTGGMEAAVVNLFSPGDPVLVISTGAFGERFASIGRAFGLDVHKLDFPWGEAANPAEVARALAANPSLKGVFVTHNETSTGITNDLGAIATVVKEQDLLLVVDAVSSMGAIDLPTDKWGCDAVVSGSQKAWMMPPGLSMVSVSEKAWQAHREAKLPRYYWDFSWVKAFLGKGQTPYTPAVSLFYALQVALRLMAEEGLPSIFERHKRLGQLTRQSVRGMGLELFGREKHASNTVTSVKVPQGVDGKELVKVLREQYGVIVAGGQGPLEGKIFRLGHLGYVKNEDIISALEALRKALAVVGYLSAK